MCNSLTDRRSRVRGVSLKMPKISVESRHHSPGGISAAPEGGGDFNAPDHDGGGGIYPLGHSLNSTLLKIKFPFTGITLNISGSY